MKKTIVSLPRDRRGLEGKNIYQSNKPKEVGGLLSDKIDFMAKSFIRDKEKVWLMWGVSHACDRGLHLICICYLDV